MRGVGWGGVASPYNPCRPLAGKRRSMTGELREIYWPTKLTARTIDTRQRIGEATSSLES